MEAEARVDAVFKRERNAPNERTTRELKWNELNRTMAEEELETGDLYFVYSLQGIEDTEMGIMVKLWNGRKMDAAASWILYI